jgi:hypothetical protein
MQPYLSNEYSHRTSFNNPITKATDRMAKPNEIIAKMNVIETAIEEG